MNTDTQQPIQLADRVRAGSEAAPWVCDEIARLDAENEQLRAQLGAARAMDRIRLDRIHELEGVIKAVHKLHAARGRYHTQLAACDLFDLCGLPNERPTK